MNKPYIYFEDLTPHEKKALTKAAFQKNKKLKWLNGFCVGFAIFTGSCISKGFFPQPGDHIGQLVTTVILSGGLAVIFSLAIIEPRVIHTAERIKNETP